MLLLDKMRQQDNRNIMKAKPRASEKTMKVEVDEAVDAIVVVKPLWAVRARQNIATKPDQAYRGVNQNIFCEEHQHQHEKNNHNSYARNFAYRKIVK